MNVLDHGAERGRFPDVAVVTAAALPEAIMDLSIGLLIAQLFEKVGSLAAQKSQRLALHRDLEGRADEADFVNRFLWPNKDVDVLGHDDVSPQGEVAPAAGLVERCDKPVPAPVLAQQGKPPEAGEGLRAIVPPRGERLLPSPMAPSERGSRNWKLFFISSRNRM